MGGDHHGHGIKIPDYKIYKVENCPRLMKVRDALARQGLRDPWLRNHVWRFNPEISGGSNHLQRIGLMVFRGFKYGFPLFLAHILLEQGTGRKPDEGHGLAEQLEEEAPEVRKPACVVRKLPMYEKPLQVKDNGENVSVENVPGQQTNVSVKTVPDEYTTGMETMQLSHTSDSETTSEKTGTLMKSVRSALRLKEKPVGEEESSVMAETREIGAPSPTAEGTNTSDTSTGNTHTPDYDSPEPPL